MPRPLLFVPPGGAVFEVTSRTFQRRLLLRPSRRLNDIIIGVLGKAQRLYEVEIFAAVFLSNHFHLLIRVKTARQLSGFMQYLKGNLAKEVGRLHGWRGGIWGRRYRPIWVDDEEGAQLERLRYILAQAAKEGLVASPLDWPGVHCARALIEGCPLEGHRYDRTRDYLARRRGQEIPPGGFATAERVVFSPLPCWAHLSPAEIGAAVRELVEEIEVEAACLHEATDSGPLGVPAILRQHPHERPSRCRRSPAPRFHAASREARRAMRMAYSLFATAYRDAMDRLRLAEGPVTFPAGCFPPRLPEVKLPFQLVPG